MRDGLNVVSVHVRDAVIDLPHHPTCTPTDPKIVDELNDAMRRAPTLKTVKFAPWVGEFYGQSSDLGSARVLVLGDSHYEWCKRCWTDRTPRGSDLTAYCIAERLVLMGEPDQLQHWTKVENAFLGAVSDMEQRRALWHKLAYYNFLQELVGFGSRIPVTSAAVWEDAQPAFFETLEALKPTLVVALGKRLWNGLPSATDLASLEANGKTLRRRRYTAGGNAGVVVCGVAHPAAGLGATWKPVLQLALVAVTNAR